MQFCLDRLNIHWHHWKYRMDLIVHLPHFQRYRSAHWPHCMSSIWAIITWKVLATQVSTSYRIWERLNSMTIRLNVYRKALSRFLFKHIHTYCFFGGLEWGMGMIVMVTIVFFKFLFFLQFTHSDSIFIVILQGDIHSKLETLALHFNSITKIEENTFVGLKVNEKNN